MKDTRLILIMLSVVLIGTWVFHLYDKSRYTKNNNPTEESKPVAEVNALLKKQQQEIDQLRDTLNTVLNVQKTDTAFIEDSTATNIQEKEQADSKNKSNISRNNSNETKSTTPSSVLKTSDLTISSSDNKLTNPGVIISFAVQNKLQDYHNAEIYAVIKKPDGSLLVKDIWETSGSIRTQKNGRVAYTQKLTFNYRKGENKKLQFQINTDAYQSGVYTIQLYQDGHLIGQAKKTLG